MRLCLECMQVLLGLKKRGFGVGKWNGFGGKVDATDKSIRDAALRELKEEAGVSVEQLEHHGLLMFEMQGDSQLHQVHVYRGEGILGELQESEEMQPKWFAIKDIPYNRMWQDDEHWYPLLFARKFFRGYFRFEDDFLLSYVLEPLKDPSLLSSTDYSWFKRVL